MFLIYDLKFEQS